MIMHPVRINPHWFFAMSMRTPVGMVAEPLETCRMVCREANWKSLRPRDFWMTGSINSMLAMYQWVMPWPMDRLVRMKAPLRGRRTFSSAGDAVLNQCLRKIAIPILWRSIGIRNTQRGSRCLGAPGEASLQPAASQR